MKQPVVVRNQFTNVNNHSHGKTPSNFIKDYTIRKEATELIYPVSSKNTDQPLLSVYDKSTQIHKLKENEKSISNDYLTNRTSSKIYSESLQMEGRCFDLTNISLSSQNILDATNIIQKAFNDAHTVMLLVVSFDTEYLKNLNVLNQNEEYKLNNNPTDHFKNNTDELKLRMAVKNSVKRLSERLGYEKPIAIGSIQLDTDNPHAHIVLTETELHEKSNALKFYDNTEWGTLNPKQIHVFENTIHNQLVLQKELAPDNSHKLQQILDYSQDLKQNYSNLKIYGQLSGLSILPTNSDYTTELLNNLKLETRISDKHLNKVQTEIKKATSQNATPISPYLKIQLTPIANQLDLPKSILDFSTKKLIKNEIDTEITSNIKSDQLTLTKSLRSKSSPEEINYNKINLLKDMYTKEDNNKYTYLRPISQTDFIELQSNLNELYMASIKNDTKEPFPLLKEYLLDTIVDANINRLISTDQVKEVLDSNFTIEPKLNKNQKSNTSNNLAKKIELTTTYLHHSIENNPVDSKQTLTQPQNLNETLILKSLKTKPKLQASDTTVSKVDALDILHDMKANELKYGPDF